MPAPNGSYMYAVKTCYPDMMYHPQSMVCEWPATVKAIKPICARDPGETEIWEIEESRIRSTRLPETSPRTIIGTQKIPTLESSEVDTSTFIRRCDPSVPFVEHPESCNKYIECERNPNGFYFYVEKNCGIDMMFNIQKKDCDFSEEVMALKPMCNDRPVLSSLDLKTEKPVVTTQAPIVTTPMFIIPSTLTPPMLCDQGEMVPLLDLLPDSAFSASSILGNAFRPESARLESKPTGHSSGSWSPKTNDLNQYLQIKFLQPVPVYGVIIRGNQMLDQYVTSFKILYSNDENVFHVYEDANKRIKIFSGSVDAKTSVKSIFQTPVEAKIVRFYPISWYGSITLRVEVLGCKKLEFTTTKTPIGIKGSQGLVAPQAMPFPQTTRSPQGMVAPQSMVAPQAMPFPQTTKSPQGMVGPQTMPFPGPGVEPERIFKPQGVTPPMPIFTEAPVEPLCDDPLGVENSKLSSSQIKFSSIKDSGSVKTKVRKNPLEIIKLSSKRGWMPLADNTNEYVMVSIE